MMRDDTKGQAGQKAPLALMIKPAGSLCNMRCSYCYYLGTDIDVKAERMDERLLERVIREYFAASDGPVYSFTWHGGEPTVVGLDFYREAVRLQQEYLPEGCECWNSLQTNGLLLDDEWCDFLRDSHFDVGLSIDGTQAVHDRFRKDTRGEGTYERVKAAAERLMSRGIKPDLLCTVTEETARHGREVYEALRDLGTGWMQFIPIVIQAPGDSSEKPDAHTSGHLSEKPDAHTPGGSSGKQEDACPATLPPSVSPRSYGQFLREVFTDWFYHDMGRTEVQFFSETALVLAGGEASLCTMRRTCGEVPVIERDGGVYACDHFVRREYKTGDLTKESLGEIVRRLRGGGQLAEVRQEASGTAEAFGESKHTRLPASCLKCEYLSLCSGGCLKDRFLPREGDFPQYWLCEGLKTFFSFAVPRLKQAMSLSARHTPPEVIMRELAAGEREKYRKISRNAPCPCGSGLKFKNCCAKLAEIIGQ